MNGQPENQNIPRKKSRAGLITIIVVAVLFIGLVIVFYGLVRENIGILENQNQTTELHIATADDPYKGGAEAKIAIVEFSDYQCPYCFQSFPVVRELINTYGDQIKFIFRDFPLKEYSQKAAEAGECAHEQGKFWEMHDKLFINQNDLSVFAIKQYALELGLGELSFNECLDSGRYAAEVQEDLSDGLLAGVDGTPTFFINDYEFQGSVTVDAFKMVIDELIAIYSQP
jgi:protein-disulfide isomerase